MKKPEEILNEIFDIDGVVSKSKLADVMEEYATAKAAQAWEEGQDAFIAAYKAEFKDEHLEYLDFMKDRIKPTNPYKQEKP
jgi:hypothetical protein